MRGWTPTCPRRKSRTRSACGQPRVTFSTCTKTDWRRRGWVMLGLRVSKTPSSSSTTRLQPKASVGASREVLGSCFVYIDNLEVMEIRARAGAARLRETPSADAFLQRERMRKRLRLDADYAPIPHSAPELTAEVLEHVERREAALFDPEPDMISLAGRLVSRDLLDDEVLGLDLVTSAEQAGRAAARDRARGCLGAGAAAPASDPPPESVHE